MEGGGNPGLTAGKLKANSLTSGFNVPSPSVANIKNQDAGTDVSGGMSGWMGALGVAACAAGGGLGELSASIIGGLLGVALVLAIIGAIAFADWLGSRNKPYNPLDYMPPAGAHLS